MATPTVTETIMSGATPAVGYVELSLVATDASVGHGYAAGTDLAFLGVQTIELVEGEWSAALNPNSGTSTDVINTPPGTRWKVVTRLASLHGPGSPVVRYLDVPDETGPFDAHELVAAEPTPAVLAVEDDMSTGYTDGDAITDDSTYTHGVFPFNGTTTGNNPSDIWEVSTGTLWADGAWAWSGLPSAHPDVYFYRGNTRSFDVKSQRVRWQYKSAADGVGGYATSSAHAVALWLRYITEYNLYALQFDRPDGRIYLKRKVPADGFTGPAGLTANLGIYYIIPTDSEQPVFGADSPYATWSGQGLLGLQHNATSTTGTIYDFEATIRTLAYDTVQVQLFRDGLLVGSWTDENQGIAANSDLLSEHVTAGYFTAVTGYQSTWYHPIDSNGSTGFRSDNIQFWFRNFELWEMGS